ncbi:MAG: helix-turn-helix domain-containing protein [Pseudonocardiaceae bacterium]
MAREPEGLVEMRCLLGAQLAAFRQAAELSQGQLARAVTVDRSTVAHEGKREIAVSDGHAQNLAGKPSGDSSPPADQQARR